MARSLPTAAGALVAAVALACVDVDFEARSITAGDVVQGEHATAAEIVNARAPRMLKRVMKEALERNSPFWSEF